MKSRISAGVGALALAMLGVSTATPAAAAPPGGPPGGPTDQQQLLLLRWSAADPWADNLTGPLFGTDHSPMVPGDAPVRTFYAFNNTGDRATLSLACTISRAGAGGADLASSLDLHYRVNDNTLAGFKTCEGAHEPFAVLGRSDNKVDVRLAFPSAHTGAMNQSASYTVTVTLRQTTRGSRPARVLGTQTLVLSPQVSSPTTSGTTSTTTTTSTGSSSSGSGKSTTTGSTTTGTKDQAAPAKTTKVAASLPADNAVPEFPLPLIGMLLAAGALLAGLRHQRPKPD